MTLTLFGEKPADEQSGGDSPSATDGAWHCTAGGWVPSYGGWANAGMGSPTEFWTLSTSESPSVAVASSLSDILEMPQDLPKYSLSPTAARGILRTLADRSTP
jgi:hypothetical protein